MGALILTEPRYRKVSDFKGWGAERLHLSLQEVKPKQQNFEQDSKLCWLLKCDFSNRKVEKKIHNGGSNKKEQKGCENPKVTKTEEGFLLLVRNCNQKKYFWIPQTTCFHFLKWCIRYWCSSWRKQKKNLPAAKEGTRALPSTGSAGLLCLLVLRHSGQELAPTPRQVPLIKKSIPEQPAAAAGSSHFIWSANSRWQEVQVQEIQQALLRIKIRCITCITVCSIIYGVVTCS